MPAEALDDAYRRLTRVDAASLTERDRVAHEEFLAEVRGLPHRNLAVELLQKFLKGQIRTRQKRNVVQARSFAALLEQAIRKQAGEGGPARPRTGGGPLRGVGERLRLA